MTISILVASVEYKPTHFTVYTYIVGRRELGGSEVARVSLSPSGKFLGGFKNISPQLLASSF